MKNLKNKLFKIIVGWIFIYLIYFCIFFVINIIPTKLNYIDRPDLPQMFKKLAEFKMYTSYFIAKHNNLNRIDVLFKNLALESKEKLKVEIFDYNDQLIFTQNYNSNNFGDTNRVRMDFKSVSDSQGKRFKIVITPLEIVDWKMYFGVKGDDIDLVQYFGKKFSINNTISDSIKLMQNWVLLLPLITLTLFLW